MSVLNGNWSYDGLFMAVSGKDILLLFYVTMLAICCIHKLYII